MLKNFTNQLKSKEKFSEPVTKPFGKVFLTEKNKYLRKISKDALKLYELRADINKFKKLVFENNNTSEENTKCKKLDPFIDEKLEELSNNEKFLKDLGLIE